ncbi:uncharacterized protein LOC116265265 [Nymphaea colorata]|uniref:uncharacterized protein LOC116265265 n=1 Tax=Nymphaea colorata TaxID=210225 RepID=UPI00214F2684|nr:uncharacterized protein LOC116265265 [Nymphaea colorata]
MVLEAAGDNSDIASGNSVGQKSYDRKEGGRILAGSDTVSNGVIIDIGDLEVEEEAEEKEERNTVEGDGENADERNKSAAEDGDTVHADETSDDEKAIHHSSETLKGLELNGELRDGTYSNSSVKSMEGETYDDQLFKVSEGTHRNQVSSCAKEVPDGGVLGSKVHNSFDSGIKHGNKSVRTIHDNSTSMTLGNTDLFVQKRAGRSSKRNSNRTRRSEKMHSRSGAAEVDGSREACEAVCSSKLEGLAHRIEELESELREAAELEVALYSIVAEHGSSIHKVHTPARRLSRMYIHAYRNWSKEKRASAARSMVSGLVLVAKACGNDVASFNYHATMIVTSSFNYHATMTFLYLHQMSNSAADLGGSFSISLWKKAFQDAFERLCPVRAAGHECGCLPLLAKLVMEQCVVWLDIAMFNTILRESPDGIPTDPISDPIIGFKVLPISPGSLSFGVGVQLKNSASVWISIFSYVGNYFWTHYFFTVLAASSGKFEYSALKTEHTFKDRI